jgi:UDP-glucose 4-epimerase
MNSLVIGGNGFIGHNLVLRLLDKGHNVTVLDKFIDEAQKKAECKYITADFFDVTENMVEGTDVVYHLAHTTIPQTSNKNPSFDLNSNVIGTIKLLEICVKRKVKKIIYASSGGTIYGIPQYLPIDEAHPLNPLSSYGISKLTTEKYLFLFQHLYGLNYEIVRMSNPYGFWQNPDGQQGVIAVFIGKILRNQKIDIWGDGKIVRDYIFIDDVMDALMLITEKQTCNNIFNVGSSIGTSLNEIISFLEQITGKKPEANYYASRKVDVGINILDTSKIFRELNWRSTTPIQLGIKKTLQWYEKNIF